MSSSFARSFRTVSGLVLASSLVISSALLPTPAAAYHGGWHGGGWHGGGWGWGWGVGAIGLGIGAAALTWPGYYPYGAYDYPYYPAYAPAPVTYVQPTQVIQAAPAPQAAPSYYYCNQPKGYYPYVTVCQTPWQAVPVAPAGAP